MLGVGLVAALVAVVAWAAGRDDGLSILVAVLLGTTTVWTSWAFYLESDGTKPGQEWLVTAVQVAILLASVVAAATVVLPWGVAATSDAVSVGVFLVCQLAAVTLDRVASRNSR